MATSSNQSTSSASCFRARKRPDLELITCSKCGEHTVEEFEAKTDEHGNRGRIFFKCPARNWDDSGCKFWFWKEDYEKLVAKLAREKEQQMQELANKKAEEAMTQKEEHMVQEGSGQKSSSEDDLGEQIRNLVIVVKEIVTVMKIIIFVAICGLVLNAYAVLRG